MEDGSHRAQRFTGGRRRAAEEPEDVLARHGLLGSAPAAPPPGGRAARRRAAEELAPGSQVDPISASGRHAADPGPRPDTTRGRYGAPDFRSADGDTPSGRHGLPAPTGAEERTRAGRRRAADVPSTGTTPPAHSPRGRTEWEAHRAPGAFGVESSGASRPTARGGEANGHHRPAAPNAAAGRGRGLGDAASPDREPHSAARHDVPSGHRRLPDPPAVAPPSARRGLPDPGVDEAPRRARTDAAGRAPSTAFPPVPPVPPAGGAPWSRSEPAAPEPMPGAARRRSGEGADAQEHPGTARPPAAGGRRHRTDPGGTPDPTVAVGARRSRTDLTDAPGTRQAPPRPVGAPDPPVPAATTALPGVRRPPAGPTAPPAPPVARRHRTEPADAPGQAATTALPAAGRSRPRRGDTGEPASGNPRERLAEDAPGHTAVGARRRRPDPDDPEVAPGPAATTAIPAAGDARARRPALPDAPATTALPTAGERPRAAARRDPEATAVVASRPGRARTDDAPGDAGATTRVRLPHADESERGEQDRLAERAEDASTRASRIDETLTRLTAAHAGLTLAVTDRRVEEEAPPPQRRPIGVTAVRLLAGALAVAVLATAAFGWGTKTWLGSAVRNAAALDPESSAVVDAPAQSGDENVLLVAGEPNADDAAPRADTVAVAHIPAGGGPVTVLAFPNDLEINRPPCERWDPAAATYGDIEQAEARTQLVTALDVGGPRCITRVVQQLSGLTITKYVGTDLGAFPAMTDAVGGAEVCVSRPVLDGVLGPVVPDAGQNLLSGVRTADFVQAGDVDGDPSPEYGRIERQQQILAAVLGEAVSGTALLDVKRLATLRPALADAVVADGAGLDQVLALATTMRRLDAEGVQFAAVPTGERNSRGNVVLRDTDAAALFGAVRTDAPLPAEATDPGASDTGPAPGDVTVEVFNASDRAGLAGEVGETLRSLGFDVGEVASADEPTPQTVIRFSPDQAAAAALLSATVPSATSVPDPGASGVLQLVLGRSFDDVVRAPSEPIALSAPTAEAPAGPAASCT